MKESHLISEDYSIRKIIAVIMLSLKFSFLFICVLGNFVLIVDREKIVAATNSFPGEHLQTEDSCVVGEQKSWLVGEFNVHYSMQSST